MIILKPSDTWPDSWKFSYKYDQEEVFGHVTSWSYYYSYRNRKIAAMDLISRNVEKGSRILDIAAGQGNFSIALAEKGYDVHWNDLRADLIGYVKLKNDTGNITYHPGNVFDLVFESAFDAVLITEVIEHVAHPDEFLAKISSLVRPGGRVVMTTPNGAHHRNSLPKFTETANPSIYECRQFQPDADGHIFLLHPDELQRLAVRSGFVVESVHLLNNPLTSGCLNKWLNLRYVPKHIIDFIERLTCFLPWHFQERYCRMIAVCFKKQ